MADLIGRLLDTKPFRNAEIDPPAWWRGDADFAPMNRPDFRLSGERLRSPSPDDCQLLISRLGEPWQRIERQVDELMERRPRDPCAREHPDPGRRRSAGWPGR
jgi:hypothetical protein